MPQKPALRNFEKLFGILITLLVLIGLFLASEYNYLLFHNIAETFIILIAWSIFIIAWNSRRFSDNKYFLFLGIAYLFIGGIDLAHTFAYKGMPIFIDYDANLPTQLWIVARYLESISLLLAPLLVQRKFNPKMVLGTYTSITILLVTSIFLRIFPDCYVENIGLTPFKIVSEYIIILILIGAIILLHRKKIEFDQAVFQLVVISIVVSIGAELAFTSYLGVYDFSNLLGHYLKFISFFLVYKAMIVPSLDRPYDTLFRNLKKSERNLQRERDALVRSNTKIEEFNKSLTIINSILRHDLLNELFKIRANLELVKMGGEDTDFDIAVNATEKGVNLIESMRNLEILVKSGDKNLRPTPLKPIVEKVVSHYSDDSIEFKVSGDCQVSADEALASVFDNIVRNAVIHSETDKIDIEINDNGKNYCEIKIADYGIGIPNDRKEKIFDLGVSYSKKKHGGLGLFIVKNVVEGYGGKVFVEDNNPKGSIFVLKLKKANNSPSNSQSHLNI
ncbi:MAG: MASE3 domain-containing protein [Candidatus Hermodarchaeota archaeon]